MTDDGVLVIDAREYRTQSQNREAARERLVALIKSAATPPKNAGRRRPRKGRRRNSGFRPRSIAARSKRGDGRIIPVMRNRKLSGLAIIIFLSRRIPFVYRDQSP